MIIRVISCLSVLISFFISSLLFAQTAETLDLNGGWLFRKKGDDKWMPATVPGTVHTDLLANKVIEDPFFRDNEKNLQWIENENWEYISEIELNEKTLRRRNLEIIFDGLDTYADVYFNDSLIIRADNMFRKWTASIKTIAKQGSNKLYILFKSPVKTADSIRKNQLPLPGGDRAFTRKAAYHYGWDWAPRFVTSGIWRNVKITGWDFFMIDGVSIEQRKITNETALLTAVLDVKSDEKADFLTHVTDKGTGGRLIYYTTQIQPGDNTVKIDFEIKNPKLWWSNGHGKQNMYDFFIESTDNRERWHSVEISTGLRNIELIQEKDSIGESFYFKLNGVPVFCKGANFIPADCFLPRVTKDKYTELIKAAKESNMNMLRVWGGGVYEDDEFYNQCDKNGILVWQDFMFACAMNPGDDVFMENVKREAIDNIKRLNNHPSIALWCGNNEVDEGWKNWGWQKQFKYSADDSAKVWSWYSKLFHDILPSVVSDIASVKNYISSSPKNGWGHPESVTSGDSHYWGVWWGMEPFEVYEKKVPRFMSEYGFQGFPDYETIEKFTLPEDRFLFSDVLKSHQKHPVGFETIQKYMDMYFQNYTEREKDLLQFAKESQYLQMYGIGKGIEAHRRAKPRCMGTLYWQFNDCWPGVSWSGIDYYGKWKKLQHRVKDLYNDILVSAVEEEGVLKVFINSDKPEDIKAKLVMLLVDDEIKDNPWEEEIEITIPANSSIIYYQIPVRILLKGHDKSKVEFHCDVQNLKTLDWYPSNAYTFVPLKERKESNKKLY